MQNVDIKTIISDVLDKLCVEVDAIEVRNDYGRTVYAIYTSDAKMLIGPHGEALDALSYIIRRMVLCHIGDTEKSTPFGVDVNDYHQKKVQSIVDEAERGAQRVRMFEHEVELSPMNAYERMIVHNYLSDSTDVSTESTGDGQYRRVVIQPTKSSELSG